MLGHQDTVVGRAQDVFGVTEYKTLDPDGGDYAVDLTGDLSHMYEKWDVVFNLGTIEHIWDAHTAYCNAARMVKVGGLFIGHAPVGPQYINHGIHLTNSKAILKFFENNGFRHLDHWHTERTLLWQISVKESSVDQFRVPLQLWEKFKETNIS